MQKITMCSKIILRRLESFCFVNRPVRGYNIRTGGLKSFEVVLAFDQIQAILKQFGIERRIVMQGVAKMKRVKNPIAVDAIKISLRMGVETGVKIRSGFINRENPDAEWNDCVHRQNQTVRGKMMVPIEVRYLSKGMHATIRAARPGYTAMVSANLLKALLQSRLNGRFFPLSLPSVEIGAIVCDECFKAGHCITSLPDGCRA